VDDADFSKMKHPPRFMISEDAALRGIDGWLRVTGREFHHMRNVMRLRAHEEVLLCAPNGVQYAGRVARFESDAAIITVASAPHDQKRILPRLILAVGMIKAARMDLLIEKAAELDAAEFWPLMCNRSVLREPGAERRKRWLRISIAAAKQSLRPRTMEILDLANVAAMVRRVPQSAFAVMCTPGAQPLGAVIRATSDSLKTCPAVVLAIGPEGDFTAEELTMMRQAGFVSAGLGTNRLRTETAALAALSIATGIFAELNPTECTVQDN
jgi:16S rRNA (uracil1498-N3)-methyltransferase